ncbi:MAG TPA: aminotransferase class I/II-fold pyridoxal phosphate-dependent enzyme, partial [Treponemataceae bacterium]|nr:aminotransferase class I/II-fold pyridoxal phosphate-dependent enzyme [Treponemataceae bacterium]
MKISQFGKKLTTRSGILQLMDDLGRPLPEDIPSYQLGGGNPARIEAVEQAYRIEMQAIIHGGEQFEELISKYDAPQGRISFIHAIVDYFSATYGWDITTENVCITNGSQSAFFYMFNLLSGTHSLNAKNTYKKTILFPLMPEYIGYADQGLEKNCMVSVPARCEYYDDHTMKYFIDFNAVEDYLLNCTTSGKNGEVGALCVSRPTNPSGNVLTDVEIEKLSKLAQRFDIPLLIDNAYGLPFPNIIFTENAKPIWNKNIVLSMSLSKIGLPAFRTGIIIAKKEIVEALSNINAIVSLASGSVGQALAERLIKNGELVTLAKNAVQPF